MPISNITEHGSTPSGLPIKIAPSLLAANFADLKTALGQVQEADYLHLDVMDGHFVPNISIGVPVVAAIRKACDLFLDVHLMISHPARFLEAFLTAGADLICVHHESFDSPAALAEAIREIKRLGGKAAVALKPATPVEVVFPTLPDLDMVLVMTVEPGFGGQAFRPELLDKVRMLRHYATQRGLPLDIQVDGGINRLTAPLATLAGANVLVAGEAVFGADDPQAEIIALRGSS